MQENELFESELLDETLNGVSDDNALNLAEGADRHILWQAKDFSIRELRLMEDDGTLIIRPDYQRKFVMDNKLSSRLIESILMDVPIPVIYIAEEKDGTFSVIDGQQRLTSFLSFIKGKYPDGRDFSLSSLKVLTELNKKKFADLDKSLQQKINTTTLHTIIIKKESQEDIKFEIFERLNTGSVKLNEDEIRNVVYRGNYVKLLSELENDDLFHKLVSKDNYKKRMIYRGMILRFFALSEKSYINYKPSIKQFCNKELRDNRNMTPDKQKEYRERFKKCLDLVNTVFGENAFKRFMFGNSENRNGKWNTNLNMSLFDIQMCGFANYEKHQIVPKADLIRESLMQLMTHNEHFIESIELSTSDKNQLQTRFRIWFDTLEKIVGQSNETRLFPYAIKKQLFQQDPTCKICGQQILSIDDAETDHIMPFSEGGTTTINNAQIAHRFCNRQKSNRTTLLETTFETSSMIDIFAIYKGMRVEAKYNPRQNIILYNDKVYDTPSAAGVKAIRDLGASENSTVNGWAFWRYVETETGEECFINELRNRT